MAWQKGQSGNPIGRRAEKPWRDAIIRAVQRRDSGKDPRALEKLADKLVKLGEGGDTTALKEIGDRLDGKPSQPIEGNLNINEVTDEELDQRLTELMAKVQQVRKRK